MAKITFPTIGSLSPQASLTLMILIEYIEQSLLIISPIVQQVGCLEEGILQKVCESLRHSQVLVSLEPYQLQDISINTIQQHMSYLPDTSNDTKREIITTFYILESQVELINKVLPYNSQILVGIALENIVYAKKRTTSVAQTPIFEPVRNLNNMLDVSITYNRHFNILITG